LIFIWDLDDFFTELEKHKPDEENAQILAQRLALQTTSWTLVMDGSRSGFRRSSVSVSDAASISSEVSLIAKCAKEAESRYLGLKLLMSSVVMSREYTRSETAIENYESVSNRVVLSKLIPMGDLKKD
jgi:hypothetical protein